MAITLTAVDSEPSTKTNSLAEAVHKLAEVDAAYDTRNVFIWGEHCTDCAMPACYATCSLYTPRQDLRCRRFKNGIERIHVNDVGKYPTGLLRVQFRKWGKLEGVGYQSLISNQKVVRLEQLDRLASGIATTKLIPFRYRCRLTDFWNRAKRQLVGRLGKHAYPDVLLAQLINPSTDACEFILRIVGTVADSQIFQRTLRVDPGPNVFRIPTDDVAALVKLDGPLTINIEPLDSERLPELILKDICFVHSQMSSTPIRAKGGPTNRGKGSTSEAEVPNIKCVLWDLDNTIWFGTLAEDGLDGLKLNPVALSAIQEFDRRGILNSIVSKNSFEDAKKALEHFGLWEFFLCPQISWEPKVGAIEVIAKALNIGSDTFAFVDDQEFERASMTQFHPQIDAFDVTEIQSLLQNERFDVQITVEGRRRRALYREEESRKTAQQSYMGGYDAFLKECNICLRVNQVSKDELGRVFELVQRTNQLNYGGARLSRVDLDKIQDGGHGFAGLVLRVTDRFGDYGIVGFAVLAIETWTVENFFLSCRVQRKKVEEAFFSHLTAYGASIGKNKLSIRYRKTPKNEPSRMLLEDNMRLRSSEETAGGRCFYIEVDNQIIGSDIVKIQFELAIAEE